MAYLYAIACVFGIVLRVLYPADSAWFNDQIWYFRHGAEMGKTLPWEWTGAESGGGVRSPGMSEWVFYPLVHVFHLTSPEQLAQTVAWLSIAAIILIGIFASRLQGSDRENWLSAGALAAVNPTGIWLERVIWNPSVLPVLLVIFWMSVWNRRRWWGAFVWGAVGACLGQIHMAGFFTAVSVLLWILLFRREDVRWPAFAIGTALTGWPVIPWLHYVIYGSYQRQTWSFWTHPPGKVWVWWILSDAGLATKYVAFNFWKSSFVQFLKAPFIAGHPTYLMLMVHAALACILAAAFFFSGRRLLRSDDNWKTKLLLGDSETGFFLRASLIGFAGLLSLLPAPVFVHYFLPIFPMGFIWLSTMLQDIGERNTKRSFKLLTTVVILQLAVSLTSAFYVHGNFGAPPGSFGIRTSASPHTFQ